MLAMSLRTSRNVMAVLGAGAAFSAGISYYPSARATPPFPAAGHVKIIPVGHRGNVKYAPENTIAAHEVAIALGARAIEFDVRFTKDGHAVVIHDASVDRTTNGTGRVSEMTLAEIKALDAGSWKDPKFAEETIPTLREALRNIKGRAAVDIDFKGGPDDAGERIVQILDEEGYRDGPLVTVFARSHHLKKLKAVAPYYVLRPHYENPARTAELKQDLGVSVMGLRRRAFSFAAAEAITSNDILLFTNVMGFADGRRGFDDSIRAGARFIQTDKMNELVPYLRERGLLESCVPARNFSCYAPAEDATAPRIASLAP